MRRSAFVEHLLDGLQAIPITEPVARVHAGVWAQLAERGEVIGEHDLWIAATAIAHGLSLATANTVEFGRVPGLQVLATGWIGPTMTIAGRGMFAATAAPADDQGEAQEGGRS